MNLRFDKGDTVQARPAPGRPIGIGVIVGIEQLSTSTVYLVQYPNYPQPHKFFVWQIERVEQEELKQAG